MSAHTKGPTLEQMHVAWLRRRKSAWPDTFEAAMQHPIYRCVLAIECIRMELRELTKTTAGKHPDPERYIAGQAQPPVDRQGFWMDTDADDP